MSKVKKYEIETLDQLVNITTLENFERISVDLVLWLNYTTEMFSKLKEQEKYKGKVNSDIAKVKFVWIDDGKNGLKDVSFHNTKTGELTNVRLKKK